MSHEIAEKQFVIGVKQKALLDDLMFKNRVKNYAALAKILGVAAPVISKSVTGKLVIGCNMILRLHETFGVPVADIRTALA